MSHDTHDAHQHSEGKKAVFGPPVIMGLAFWLFAFFFLSLCNPKHHGHEAAEGHGHKMEQSEKGKTEAASTTEETPKTTEEAAH